CRQISLRIIAAGLGKRIVQACAASVELAFCAEMSWVETSASKSGDEFAALQKWQLRQNMAPRSCHPTTVLLHLVQSRDRPMEFQIATAGREPIYRQLAGQIREGVARGQLAAGDRLPSVRELSRRLVVNPNTIARV